MHNDIFCPCSVSTYSKSPSETSQETINQYHLMGGGSISMSVVVRESINYFNLGLAMLTLKKELAVWLTSLRSLYCLMRVQEISGPINLKSPARCSEEAKGLLLRVWKCLRLESLAAIQQILIKSTKLV
jgi:hypothetical protein